MSWQILIGDVLSGLASLPDKIALTCVTSPPYWGLRDYGSEAQLWGGNPSCDHDWITERTKRGNGNGGTGKASRKQPASAGTYVTDTKDRTSYSDWCSKCDAWRGGLGLEPTPELYVEHLVEVFRKVKSVLRDDGTLWLNLGDSYASSGGHAGMGPNSQIVNRSAVAAGCYTNRTRCGSLEGIKQKDLIGIPWMVAFALRADGWYLRSEITWAKKAPMPESVTDRPSSATEKIFLFAKSRSYYYDADAIREAHKPVSIARRERIRTGGKFLNGDGGQPSGNPHSITVGLDDCLHPSGRNARNFWLLGPEPYAAAHFATFPTEIPRRAILAGTSEAGCCAACGSPYRRVVRKGEPDREHQRACGGDVRGEYHGQARKDYASARAENASEVKARILAGMTHQNTSDWKRTCDCHAVHAPPVPALVLDPFLGSGTTLAIAKQLGRHGIGCELNPEYAKLAEARIASETQGMPIFAPEAASETHTQRLLEI